MGKSNPESEPKRLAAELDAIRREWRFIRIQYFYDGPDYDRIDDDEYWRDITVQDMILMPEKQLGFAEAYSAAKLAAWRLACQDLADWAVRVIDYFGEDQFRTDAQPQVPASRSAIRESSPRAPLLAGTEDVIEAGKRIILWAASFADPLRYRREEQHRQIFSQWVYALVLFDFATLPDEDSELEDNPGDPEEYFISLLPDPLDWVAGSFDYLATNPVVNPAPPMTAAQLARILFGESTAATTKKLREWIKKGKISGRKAKNLPGHYIVSAGDLELLRLAHKKQVR